MAHFAEIVALSECSSRGVGNSPTRAMSHDLATDGDTMTDLIPLSADELAAESCSTLPDKEVLSLLDLDVNLDLALDLAAPIDLAVAANANVAAPIDASVGANVLSAGSTAQALTEQGTAIDQSLTGSAIAHGNQASDIAQGAPPAPEPTPTPTPAPPPTNPGDALSGPLLNVNVNVDADLKLAAPINGGVALNANVAAPIDASAGANVGSTDCTAAAVAHQEAVINQHLDANAEATADQQSTIKQ
jgi:hypothetical protein